MPSDKPKITKAQFEARGLARKVIAEALRKLGPNSSDIDRELVLRRAYPFGRRSGTAFEQWCLELNEQLGLEIDVNKKKRPAVLPGQLALGDRPEPTTEPWEVPEPEKVKPKARAVKKPRTPKAVATELEPWEISDPFDQIKVGQVWKRDKPTATRARVESVGTRYQWIELREAIGVDSKILTQSYAATTFRVVVKDFLDGWSLLRDLP